MFMESVYFDESEFVCKCGCGECRMDEAFIKKLHSARAVGGVPFRITSGYRCDAHNKAVGGSPTSSHRVGKAADIACDDSKLRWQIVSALKAMGFTRIGIADTFIHVDLNYNKPQERIWVY